MRITKEYIGKKVRQKGWGKGEYRLIEWMGGEGEYIAGHDEKGYVFAEKAYSTSYRIDTWELYQEEKKPSERINEIAYKERLDNSPFSFSREVDAIKQYLDEQAAKK